MFDPIDRAITDFERGRLTRRQLVARITGFAAAAVTTERLARSAAAGQASTAGGQEAGTEKQPAGTDRRDKQPTATFQAVGLNHIALAVTDVGRSRDFYLRHLGLSVMRDGGQNSCFLSCGEHFVALFRSDKAGLHHYCYTVKDYEPGKAVELLKAADLKPQRQGNRVYFDDPDGLSVQVSAKNE